MMTLMPDTGVLSADGLFRILDQKLPTAMNETTELPPLPDRLSVDPRSPYHDTAVFAYHVGIRFNGKERMDVEEYCISQGWVKVPAGKTLDRKGKPLLLKLMGNVEAFYS